MCGIVGIIGDKPVATRLIGALKKLEYRGYDSAGISVSDQGSIKTCKVAGNINALQREYGKHPIDGFTGIGHTRWATHGEPSVKNAHPHSTEAVTIVHNGIIENHEELRRQLISAGCVFNSDTDTEVALHLLDSLINSQQNFDLIAKELMAKIDGSYAIVAMVSDGSKIIALKKGAPLAIGIGDGEMYVGSDALALSDFTRKTVYLEDGDFAIITRDSYKIYDTSLNEVDRKIKLLTEDLETVGKGEYKHFMLKEIHEEPSCLQRVFEKYYDPQEKCFKVKINLCDYSRIYIVGCGTSYYAATVAKHWIEKYLRIPVELDIASEFRYRDPVLEPNALLICISQSGETSDVLSAIKSCKGKVKNIAAIVNVVESSIANFADFVLPVYAGYEIGVASTKAYINQLGVFASMVMACWKPNSEQSEQEKRMITKALFDLPSLISGVLADEAKIKEISYMVKKAQSMIYVGRGVSYSLALEGALKIKELSYIHAEGIAAGELKHGTIALIDEELPVIAILPNDAHFTKSISNIQEIKARNGFIIALTDSEVNEEVAKISNRTFTLPKVHDFVVPILYSVPLQLLAYHAADIMGKDVDQPRNLAKSVTVE